MGVMPAGVHHAIIGRGILGSGLFLNRKRVYITAQSHGPTRLGPAHEADYVRPIVLIQAEDRGGVATVAATV